MLNKWNWEAGRKRKKKSLNIPLKIQGTRSLVCLLDIWKIVMRFFSLISHPLLQDLVGSFGLVL